MRRESVERDAPSSGGISRRQPAAFLTPPSGDAPLAGVQATSVVTAELFAQGMTVDQYVAYTDAPENLAREAGGWLGTTRHDFSGLLRQRYELCPLADAQVAAIRWLAARPEGPARVLVSSEEWSSDCRRDVPMVARLRTCRPFRPSRPRSSWRSTSGSSSVRSPATRRRIGRLDVTPAAGAGWSVRSMITDTVSAATTPL